MENSFDFSVRKYGKINLFLKVFPVENNGYHKLLTVFQPVNLYDDIFLKLSSESSHIVEYIGRVSGNNIFGEKDLCLRATKLFLDKYICEVDCECKDKFHIRVDKNIPVQGGMAGGSVDAAGVLCLLNEYYGFPFTVEQLEVLASTLGADVPFGVRNVLSIGCEYGNKITPVVLKEEFCEENICWLLLINKTGLSTPSVFSKFDEMNFDGKVTDKLSDNVEGYMGREESYSSNVLVDNFMNSFLDAYSSYIGICGFIVNDLQPPALQLRDDLRKIFGFAENMGLKGFVSGSGPTVVFACKNNTDALNIKDLLLEQDFIQESVQEILIVGNK